MATHEAEAIDRLTAAVLALATTVELQGPDAPPETRMAHENVQRRYRTELANLDGQADAGEGGNNGGIRR